MSMHLESMFAEMAEEDGTYAIAYALMQIARKLDRMAFNDENPAGAPGTTEKIAMELTRIADAIGGGRSGGGRA